jgi:tetratricopeptide (TPR) repeat protein
VSDALYERYKDALRRGHVAALRGRSDTALEAYLEAAAIAPERALPHVGIGTISLRLGRPADALVAFDAALVRAPADEAALAGRADALIVLERRAEAAATLDRLAAALAPDRPAEALDSAVRALQLAESRPRRRAVGALAERLAATGVDPADERLARAARLIDVSGPAGPEADAAWIDHALEGEGPLAPGELWPEAIRTGDPLAALIRAEAAAAAGDDREARQAFLEAARGLAATGRSNAAIDACYQALALGPDDPDLHIALAGLYIDRGWRTTASEKLALLERLAELSGDEATAERVRAVALQRLGEVAVAPRPVV